MQINDNSYLLNFANGWYPIVHISENDFELLENNLVGREINFQAPELENILITYAKNIQIDGNNKENDYTIDSMELNKIKETNPRDAARITKILAKSIKKHNN